MLKVNNIWLTQLTQLIEFNEQWSLKIYQCTSWRLIDFLYVIIYKKKEQIKIEDMVVNNEE